MIMIKKAAKSAVLCVAALSTVPAMAITVSETTDFPGSSSFGSWATSVGMLDAGTNTVSGSLNGSCLDSSYGIDCNPGSGGGDEQDSFLIEIGNGFVIDSLFVTTSNVSGPAGLGISFSLNDTSYTVLASDYWLPLGSITGDLAISPIGAGIYDVSMYGQGANATGPYALDYSIEINVSSVPVPAAMWLFGSGLMGFLGVARRKC